MPLRWFEVDGERIPVERALTSYELVEHYPLTYLQLISRERVWEGVPSVTQCIKGTRQAYLELTEDYGIDPDNSAFQVLGTKAHLNLDSQEYEMTEVDLRVDNLKGTSDLLEPAPGNRLWLTDYKTWGSYPVMRALGIEMIDVVKHYDDGDPMIYKSGKRKGQTMTRKEPRQTHKPDMREAGLQTNKYRQMAQRWLRDQGDDREITVMRIFATVRDGNCISAKQRGVMTNTASIQVPRMEDEILTRYFERKQEALLAALEDGDVPGMCNDRESWDGRKCQGYCPVAESCARQGDNPHLSTLADQLRGSIAEKIG